MSELKAQVEKLNQISEKISTSIDQIVKEAMEKNEWRNIRIMRGRYVQVLVTATPNGGLMVRLCGQRLKNCLKVTREKQLKELLETIAIIGNADKFVETLGKKLSEINGESESEVIDLW